MKIIVISLLTICSLITGCKSLDKIYSFLYSDTEQPECIDCESLINAIQEADWKENLDPPLTNLQIVQLNNAASKEEVYNIVPQAHHNPEIE